jgi:hypothetical protein
MSLQDMTLISISIRCDPFVFNGSALEYVARFDNDVQGHFKKLLDGEVDGQSDGCVY